MWIEPKTDWKSEDYYNAEDFNRIENNTNEMTDILSSIHYNVPDITVVTDRDMTNIEYLSSINRVESNIEAIKKALFTPPGWQNTKTWTLGKRFDYKDANRLENNLKLLHDWASVAKENLIYCGTFSCGTRLGRRAILMASVTWQDRIVEKPRTFTVQNNPDGTITLIPAPGQVVQEGTPVNAANLNALDRFQDPDTGTIYKWTLGIQDEEIGIFLEEVV